jgi:hypothetical protein
MFAWTAVQSIHVSDSNCLSSADSLALEAFQGGAQPKKYYAALVYYHHRHLILSQSTLLSLLFGGKIHITKFII